MSELLIELFCEEIPAVMQKNAETAYLEIFTKYFQEKEIGFKEIKVFITPRRIAICLMGLDKETKVKLISIKGPSTSSPKQAIEGFCKSNNIKESDLIIKDVKGQNCYFYEQEVASQSVRSVLLNTLAEVCMSYVWPKSMYWSDHKTKWVRPLKNILCLFDGEVIPFVIDHLVANDSTWGHRFMSSRELKVKNFVQYQQSLKENFVILDRLDRMNMIKSSLEAKASELGLYIKEDQALLEEVAGLVEYPVLLQGTIDKKFLAVPSEILVTSMRVNQKYFSLFDKDQNFAPYFLFVSNIKSLDTETVIKGNEKVLSARLSDALYFYEQDLKTPLEQSLGDLGRIIFHAKLGSLKDKVNRLVELTKIIAPDAKIATEAAMLCKSDIVSEVVGEFPNLQGVMGYHYAIAEGKKEIAEALRDHYKPYGPSDSVPSGSAAILALADKIDSLCGLMLAGEKPTGSKDPYALRRLALGIIRIILENELSQDLVSLIKSGCQLYSGIINCSLEDIDHIVSFIEERAKNYFKDEFEISQINATIDFKKEPDLVATKEKISSLSAFLKDDNGEALLNSYKRTNNIIGKLELTGQINQELFNEYDKQLFDFLSRSTEIVNTQIQQKQFSMSLQTLAALKPIIAEYFDNVMVMDQNHKIASNRLLLLDQTRLLFNKIANFDLL